MLKAAFITPGAYPIPSSMGGSVERVVEKVVPNLLPNVDATIYGRTAKRLAARGKLNGVTVERYPGDNKERYFKQVCTRLAKTKPNVIQVENRPLWIPRFKRAFPKSRIGLSLHSTTFISLPFLNKRQRKRCLQAADYIQVNSEFLSSYVKKLVPQVADKIRVNHLGVDTSGFPGRSTPEGRSLREKGRAEQGWGDRRIVLYVGRLVPQKGVHHLLTTLPALISRAPDVLVVIVGSALYGSHRRTEYVKQLYKLAARWKKHVHFVPYVPHNEIPKWFAMADIAVVPSVGTEAFGLVNLEAMAAELPVVATRAGGMKEVVVDGLTGFLVNKAYPTIILELASRISYLLENEEVRKKIGIKGRERVMNQFLWQHTAERWLAFQQEE
ncbi:glycosyltransferase family 4 protein [Cohnella silvisoli]|uniref:Glycosyltransferase family 4 protein n=1 Tax=Cohnella silvisoli TaxID=2873699 RepID=A0ABV1L1Y7_9BACL|nr:glycosyltransferase family 4 protein [Cohnella silvisoli]MCD9026454.1 glycosyltransferase family 4 protein [Cohnella silvisoli]